MSITGGTLTLTRLRVDGSPDPTMPPLVLPAGTTFTFTERTTAMPEDTTAPEPPIKVSKAAVLELRRLVAEADRRAEQAMMDLRTSEDRRKAAEAADTEAMALAGCVAAIEAMHREQARRDGERSRSINYASPMPARWGNTAQPEAMGDPVGRILLHLAARYGVAIEPTVPTPPEGPVLVHAPREWADALQHLAEQGWPR